MREEQSSWLWGTWEGNEENVTKGGIDAVKGRTMERPLGKKKKL